MTATLVFMACSPADYSIFHSFNHSFLFDICKFYITYSYFEEARQLTIQYSPNTSQEVAMFTIPVPPHQLTPLHHLIPFTLYEFTITLDVNESVEFHIEGTVNTSLSKNGTIIIAFYVVDYIIDAATERLTAANLGLLITGLIILFVTFLLFIIVLVSIIRKLGTEGKKV